MRFAPRMATLALATVLATMLGGTSASADNSAPRPVGHYARLAGTVVAVDHRARTLELLTGVGHALRVTRVHMPAELGIRARGGEAQLTALTPGCIVRVECKSAGKGTEASSVELLQAPPSSHMP